jgi:membrane associated rhomboid family serine protease
VRTGARKFKAKPFLTFLPLSWLVLLRGRRDYLAVWLGVYATAIPVWLLWPNGSHGLSGVVYGLLCYLLLIGWIEKRPLSLLLSVLALVTYAGVLPSLLPIFSPPGRLMRRICCNLWFC